jgi:type I restriction enzyme S subunit
MDRLPKEWEFAKISEACSFRPPKKEVAKKENIDVSFVPMATVEEHRMFFETTEIRDIKEVYKGYTYFQNNDVLLAKVTPCFENGKSAIARNLKNGIGFGSSEFYVLRPNKNILSEWIYWQICNNSFLSKGKNNMSGAVGLKRLTQDFLLNYEISIPPLPEQKRIVTKLDTLFERINKSIDLLEENIKQTGHLKASVLDEVFTNLESEHRLSILKDVMRVINGRAYKKPEMLESGKYPLLRVGNFFTSQSWYYSDLELEPDKYCDKGDLLYAWSASFGPKIWDGNKTIFHYHIWKMEPVNGKIDREFAYYLLQRDTDKIKEEGGRGVGMIHITKAGMEKRQVVVPPIDIQKKVVRKLKTILTRLTDLENEQQEKLNNLKALKESILDKAFKGKL